MAQQESKMTPPISATALAAKWRQEAAAEGWTDKEQACRTCLDVLADELEQWAREWAAVLAKPDLLPSADGVARHLLGTEDRNG